MCLRWEIKDAYAEIVRRFEFFTSRADTVEQMKSEKRKKDSTWGMENFPQDASETKTEVQSFQHTRKTMVAPPTTLWSVQSSNGEISSRTKKRWRITQVPGEDPGDNGFRIG